MGPICDVPIRLNSAITPKSDSGIVTVIQLGLCNLSNGLSGSPGRN